MGQPRARARSDGTVAWQVPYRLNGRQTSETFETHDAAQRFIRLLEQVGPAEARRILAETDPAGPVAPTLVEWTEHYLTHATGITAGTRGENRRLAARSWLPVLGGLPVDFITRDHVRRWVNEYGQAKSAKTVKNAHGLLSTVLAGAVEAKHRPDNPARGIPLPDQLAGEMVFLTTGEFARLVQAVPERWRPLVLTIGGTGLRWGEVTALRWQDVDLDTPVPVLHVRQAWKRGEKGGRELGPPKTRRSRRTVSLPRSLVRVLDPLRGGPDELVFRAVRGGRLHHQVWQPRVWVPAVEQANLGKRPRVHDLRHSHVAWLIQQGRPAPEIQRRLGHESVATTIDVYGHLFPDAHGLAAAAVELALVEVLPELED